MTDLRDGADIKRIMRLFYDKLLSDARISYIFTDIVPIHLEEHLDTLVVFWSQLVLGTGGYTRNMTQIHLDVHHKSALTPELFAIWLAHFEAAVDACYAGEKAESMKAQARQLALILQIKMK